MVLLRGGAKGRFLEKKAVVAGAYALGRKKGDASARGVVRKTGTFLCA